MERAPYYVWAPPFVQTSAGVRVLYKLVHELNGLGENAWVAMSPYYPDHVPQYLNAPVLTNDILRSHKASYIAPIAIYPEVVVGNPLRASAVVRYVMNEPGLLGGPTTFPGELVFGYGALLAEGAGFADNILFLPAIDLADFPPPPADTDRSLILFYASKYRAVHMQEPFGLPGGALEITRDEESAPDPKTLIQLLCKADRIYVFENTAIAIEAPLCGCITIMMPNEHLSYPIGAREHGMGGIAWGDDPDEISRARESLGMMRIEYEATVERSRLQMIDFVAKTQAYANRDRPTFLRGRLPEFGIVYSNEAAEAAQRVLTKDGGKALVSKGIQVIQQRGVLAGLSIIVRLARKLAEAALRTG